MLSVLRDLENFLVKMIWIIKYEIRSKHMMIIDGKLKSKMTLTAKTIRRRNSMREYATKSTAMSFKVGTIQIRRIKTIIVMMKRYMQMYGRLYWRS